VRCVAAARYRLYRAPTSPRPLSALRAAATLLFIGTTYFWMVPRYHDVAILDEPIHYLWHATLLLSGLVFFWRVLDPRPYRSAPRSARASPCSGSRRSATSCSAFT
jgi:hypothetical protein